ncbi:MFS transporter [Actinomadura nitritigenes]|uniref:MFS transporter n=1 Tax=Actinomadura nitritigenes TaxID=134602 RepID=UPI003D8D15D7
MSRTPSARPIGIGVSAALVTGAALGNLGSNLMPVLLPGMADRFHLSDTTSGMVATVQLIATALAALALAARAERPGRARIARFGLAATTAGFGLAFAAPGLPLLTLGNVIAGVGLGVVYAVAMAAIAATDDTDRASTVAVLGATIVLAALIILVPLANDAWGGAAGFAVLAACCVPAFWLVRALPDAAEHGRLPASGAPVPKLFLLALVVLGATEQGAWSYSEILGEDHAGMSTDAVSSVLSISSVVCLAGVVLAPMAARKAGRLTTMAAFVAVEVVAKLVIAAVPWSASFTIAALVWQTCYMAILVLVLAVAAAADPGGRWVAATSGATAIGTGLGPAPVGWILDTWGAPTLGMVLALVTAVVAIPLLRVAGAVESETPRPAALSGSCSGGGNAIRKGVEH